MLRAVALVACLALGGCGTGSVADSLGVVTGFKAFNAQLASAPSYFAAIDEDFKKNDAQLMFLTKGQSCVDLNVQAIKDYRAIPLRVVEKKKARTITIREYEEARLVAKTKSIEVLRDYAMAMEVFAEGAAGFEKATGYMASISSAIDSVPVVGAQTAMYSEAFRAILTALAQISNHVSAGLIQQKARELQPRIDAIVAQLKKDYKLIDDDAQLFISAWQTCVEAKYQLMRDNRNPAFAPSTTVEIDNAYGAYLDKKKAYLDSIPSVNDELDAIAKANRQLATIDLQYLSQSAASLASTANAVNNAVNRTKGVRS